MEPGLKDQEINAEPFRIACFQSQPWSFIFSFHLCLPSFSERLEPRGCLRKVGREVKPWI